MRDGDDSLFADVKKYVGGGGGDKAKVEYPDIYNAFDRSRRP